MTVTVTKPVRVTVELPDDDYRVVRVAAAAGGPGTSMSSFIRDLVHEYVEQVQDEVDVALVLERMKDTRPSLTGTQVADRLAAKRTARGAAANS
jgi:hypothetical protein